MKLQPSSPPDILVNTTRVTVLVLAVSYVDGIISTIESPGSISLFVVQVKKARRKRRKVKVIFREIAKVTQWER